MRDTLLLACGSQDSRTALRAVFEDAYNLLEAETGRQAALLLEQNQTCIAVILLDLTVPGKGDRALLETMQANQRLAEVPLLVILDEHSAIDEAGAFAMGASDVISLPCDPLVIHCRTQTIVDLNRHKWHLQELLDEQTEILRHSNDVMVDALSSIIEYRSVESGQHILRIRRFTRLLLEEVARSCPEYNLDEGVIRIIASAAALHDIGKIAIPDSILNKPAPLTEEEWVVMRTHAVTGCRILETLSGQGNPDYLRYAHNICHYHHERWDGSGYPEGLSGEDIPICAQVVGLADAYDALTNIRVYKDAIPCDRAANMILRGECGQFSPKLLDCFKQVSGQMAELSQEYADGRSPNSDDITVPLPPPSLPSDTDTLHMTQMRYHALLHHMNVTIAEADLDQGIFHLVYNPDPNLSALYSGRDFTETAQILLEQLVFPEDREAYHEILYSHIPKFLEDGLRKQTHSLRITDKTTLMPVKYRVSILRLNLSDPSTRKLLVLWERDTADGNPIPMWQDSVPVSGVFSSIACFACYHNDRFHTMAHFSESLTAMLGYTEEEFLDLFRGHYIELVLPEDRAKVLRATEEQLAHGTTLEIEYRMRHKNGSVIWVINKSRLLPGISGHEYLYGILLDITQTKAASVYLQETLERHQIILSQTQNVIFEWDMVNDTIQYFGDWWGIFGYEPLKSGLLSRLDTESHFHPEDIPVLLAAFRALQSGTSYQAAEVRLASADGHYLWCRFRATAQHGPDEAPTKIVGLITNIDQEKRSSQLLLERAERDSLTKLLNKEASRRQIEEFLAEGKPAALIIIDLDNFKSVNDRHGHLFGDALLAQTASTLRRLFRADDIVARIGGDEFMVLMKGSPSASLVQDRCRRLVSTLNRVLQDLSPGCDLSCSVGVALAPEHGVTYHELFLHADQALYIAKDGGKNTFLFYDGNSSKFLQRRAVSAITARIDSNEQSNLPESGLILYAFQRLYESGDVSGTINHMLEMMGKQMNVSRAYIFENNPENTHCSNTFEWCNEGVLPEIQNLQNVSYAEDIPGYLNSLNEHSILYCTDISALSRDLYDILAPQGIKAMLHCAIRDQGVLRGYVGFDDCSSNRLWTQEQIDTLTFFSEMLSVFLLKKRAQDKTDRYAADLASVLDNQNAWIYVIDPDDCTLKFLNAKTRALAPDAQVGMKCHKCLMGRNSRCPNCPAIDIREKKNNQLRLENLYLGLSVESESTLITWDGKDACLLTCRPVKP